MNKRYAIVLAAGQGTRMKSKLYKVMHPVMGKPMVGHIVDATQQANVDKVVTVTGVGAETVQDYLGKKSDYVLQEEQLGTAHAVKQAESVLASEEGNTLVLCGDTPLLKAETIEALFDFHEKESAKATVLTAHAPDPTGYGRVIRSNNGAVEKIVEQKDASKEEEKIQEISTGTYCFDNRALFEALQEVKNDNVQNEYYLPDVMEILKEKEEHIAGFKLDSMDEALGVNDRVALAHASRLMKERINKEHMRKGVTFIDPSSTYVESDVEIGADTVLEPGVYVKGQTTIGENTVIGAHSVIENSRIGNNVTVTSSTIEEAVMKDGSDIGPNSHLRPGAILAENVHVGNYVEVKKATIGEGSKVGHHTYVGNAKIGKDVNVSCGTIFVNYDGKNKHMTTVGDHAFIGCNVNIIAPAAIAERAFIAAGSTITKDVPEDALAIARARQENKEGYARKLPYYEK